MAQSFDGNDNYSTACALYTAGYFRPFLHNKPACLPQSINNI